MSDLDIAIGFKLDTTYRRVRRGYKPSLDELDDVDMNWNSIARQRYYRPSNLC